MEVYISMNATDPTNIPATVERAVNQFKRYVHKGREMRLNAMIRSYEMDEVVLDLGSKVNVMTK